MAPDASKSESKPPSTLTATYNSPTSTKAFTHTLPTSATSSAASTEEKTRYLSALRESVVQLQGEINEFLTEKMEEDKWVASEKGGGAATVDEKEEENYGEEGGEHLEGGQA